MILIVVMFFVALLLIAFFNGAETGFYRMTRVRLVMEAVSGDRIARIMLWFANQPSLFVATTLIGMNLSHSVLSTAIVMAADRISPHGGTLAELLATIVVAPIVFICGDLTPKNLFFSAPNRLMRRVSPALLAAAVLFAPLTIVLWMMSQVWRFFTHQRPEDLRASLARRELNELLAEGHEAGILRPVQRTLAQTMLAIAPQPVKNFAVPAGRIARATTTMSKSDVLRLAQRHRRTLLPVEEVAASRRLVGFLRTSDLFLSDGAELPEPSPLVELAENESFLSALAKLPVAQDALGHVVGVGGKTVGFVTGRELRLALFRTA